MTSDQTTGGGGVPSTIEDLRDLLLPTFGATITNAFYETCVEDEYDMEGIYAEFEEDLENNGIIDSMDDHLADTAQAFIQEVRYLLHIDQRPPEAEPAPAPEPEQEPTAKPRNQKPSKPSPSFVSPSEVHWQYHPTAAQVQHSSRLMDEYCFAAFASFPESALMKFVAIGTHSRVPDLLLLIHDIYSRMRTELIIEQHSAANGLHVDDFLQRCAFLQQRGKNVTQLIKTSLTAYGNRVLPSLKVNIGGGFEINDDINAYIEYTILVANLIAAQFQTANQRNTNLCPIQVDLVVLTKGSAMGGGMSDMEFAEDDDGFDDDDESDDDSDDDSKNGQNNNNNKNSADAKPKLQECSYLSSNIEDCFNQFNAMHGKQSAKARVTHTPSKHIDYQNGADDNNVRMLRELTFDNQAVFGANLARTRLVILVDRREAKDVVICYTMPEEYSAIGADSDFSCINCISVSCEYLLPDMNTKWTTQALKKLIGAKHDSQGRIFNVSFQCGSEDNVRMEWFFNGGGARFTPAYMTTLWPMCFSKQALQQWPLHEKYNDTYFADNFALDTSDARFDHWHDTIVGRGDFQ